MEDNSKIKRDTPFDEQAKLLGFMLIEFGMLEVRVAKLIARLLGQEEDWVAAIFAAELMFFPKLRLANALLEAKITDHAKRQPFVDALRRAEACNKKRNEYVHSEYSIIDPSNTFQLAKTMLRKTPDRHAVQRQDGTLDNLLRPVDEQSSSQGLITPSPLRMCYQKGTQWKSKPLPLSGRLVICPALKWMPRAQSRPADYPNLVTI